MASRGKPSRTYIIVTSALTLRASGRREIYSRDTVPRSAVRRWLGPVIASKTGSASNVTSYEPGRPTRKPRSSYRLGKISISPLVFGLYESTTGRHRGYTWPQCSSVLAGSRVCVTAVVLSLMPTLMEVRTEWYFHSSLSLMIIRKSTGLKY